MKHVPVPPADYVDLEIRILEHQAQKGYPVELSLGTGQKYPRGYLRSAISSWTPTLSLEESGAQLFELLFEDERLRRHWAEIRGRSAGRRIHLKIDDGAPALHALPWELLREVSPGLPDQTLAATAKTPFSRAMAGTWPTFTPIEGRPLTMLVVIANPAGLDTYPALGPIDVEAEKHAIEDALASIGPRELQIRYLTEPVTLAKIERALTKGSIHFLHIVAHGVYQPKQQQAFLFLADEDNRIARVSDNELAQLIERQPHPPSFVFLASCQSATRSPAEALRGFAPRLLEAGVPAVLAMQDVVAVKTARAFTRTFYRQLLRHGLVDVAANQARSALLSARAPGSWATPVLFSRVPHGRLLVPSPGQISWDQVLKIGSALFAFLSLVALILDLTGVVGAAREPGGLLHPYWPAATATPTPLGPGFNIVVAQFAFQGADGTLTVTDESEQISAWLFSAIEREVAQLPSALSVGLRGPAGVPMLPEPQDSNAADVARRHAATVLIYGTVRADSGGGYTVEPRFYVADDSFTFGSELVGADRLGTPVAFTPPLTPGVQLAINTQLNARTLALQHIVAGLAQFYVGRYTEAIASFDRATTVEGWADADGKEVAFLLKGAAGLRLYSQQSDAAQRAAALIQAGEAFSKTYELDSDYARGYLGLGAVALQTALDPQPSPGVACAAPGIAQVDLERLEAAKKWYTDSQDLPNQPASAHIAAKADYGLGQIFLLEFECGLPGHTAEPAQEAFARVVQAYAFERPPELTWLAGNAHGYLGRLAGHRSDWQTMAGEYHTAIDLFKTMAGNRPNRSIALAWASVGYAEQQRGNTDAARDAYQQALTTGAGVVDADSLRKWSEIIDQLS